MTYTSLDIYINMFKKLGDLDKTLKPTILIDACVSGKQINHDVCAYPVFSSLVYGYMFDKNNCQTILPDEYWYAYRLAPEEINTHCDNMIKLYKIIDDIPTSILNTKTINKLFRKIDDTRFNLDKQLNKKFKLLLKLTIYVYKCYIDYTTYINTTNIEEIRLQYLYNQFERLENQLEALHIPHDKVTPNILSVINNNSKETYCRLYFDPLKLLDLRQPIQLNSNEFLHNTLSELIKPYKEFNLYPTNKKN